MRSAFQESIANEVLTKLESRPHNISELAKALDRNYHTTREVVHSLMAEGIIVRSDNMFRNGKVQLVGPDSPTAVIPLVTIGDKFFKLTEILSMRFVAKPNAATAVSNFPMHITRLLNIAVGLSQGKDQTRTLKLLQKEMERDLEYIKQAALIYEQVLSNPINWNPESLKRYPTDPALDSRDLSDAYSHYFDTKKEEEND